MFNTPSVNVIDLNIMSKSQISHLETHHAIAIIREHGSQNEKLLINRFDTPPYVIRKIGRDIIKKIKKEIPACEVD